MAMNPVFNQQAIWCFAHMAAACCLVWSVYFIALWSERGRLWQVFVAGLLLGCIPAIRYPEALFVLGVGVFILLHRPERRRIWLHALVGVAGVAIPLGLLLVRNQVAFGAFWRTAYMLTNEQTAFGWSYFTGHLVGYVRGLHASGIGLFFPLGMLGIAMMCGIRQWRRVGVLLALLIVPITLLYMAYYWSNAGDGLAMRFLVPTFACYALAGTWLLARVNERAPALARWLVIVTALVLQFAWGALHIGAEAQQLLQRKQVLATATDALEKHVEPGDLVIANADLLQHLDFVRRWRLVDAMALQSTSAEVRSMPPRRDQDQDVPQPVGPHAARHRADRYAGLSPSERRERIAADLDEWAGERRVYFVGSEDELAQIEQATFTEGSFRILARVELPQSPPMTERGRMGPGMPPFGGPGLAGPPGDGPSGDFSRPESDQRGQRQDRPGMFGGGPMGGPGSFVGERELVIAEWIERPGTDPGE